MLRCSPGSITNLVIEMKGSVGSFQDRTDMPSRNS